MYNHNNKAKNKGEKMYDYVIQYGLNLEATQLIQEIKRELKQKRIPDKEKKWLPHITIDLYKSNNKNEFIHQVEQITQHIKSFTIELNELADFDQETLYLNPTPKEQLLINKKQFDQALYKYQLPHRRKRIYKPHITLCTNDKIEKNTYDIAKTKFRPFTAKVKYVWIYTPEIVLVKQIELK